MLKSNTKPPGSDRAQPSGGGQPGKDKTMKMSRSGKSVIIEVNPERHYHGQFVGYEYYHRSDLDRVFGSLDWATVEPDGYDTLGISNRNDSMIQHHCTPWRRVGHIVE